MREKENRAYWILSAIIVVAIFSRLFPHPPNFTAVGGATLFAGAYMKRKYLAFLIPLVAIWITDLLLNNLIFGGFYSGFVWFTKGAFWIYISYIFILILGMKLLRKINLTRILGGSIGASVIFFVFSNIGVWLSSGMYAKSFSGLMTTYVAALPFFGNTGSDVFFWNLFAGNIFYTTVIFGAFYLISKYAPSSYGLQVIRSKT